MLDRKTIFGEMGYLCLALGLNFSIPECAGTARDALAELIRERERFNQSTLTRVMRTLIHSGGIKANRWTMHLSDIARISDTHRETVCRILQEILSGDAQEIPKDIHTLLELLVEMIAETGMELSGETKAYLSSLKPGGKTGALAKKLLQ